MWLNKAEKLYHGQRSHVRKSKQQQGQAKSSESLSEAPQPHDEDSLGDVLESGYTLTVFFLAQVRRGRDGGLEWGGYACLHCQLTGATLLYSSAGRIVTQNPSQVKARQEARNAGHVMGRGNFLPCECGFLTWWRTLASKCKTPCCTLFQVHAHAGSKEQSALYCAATLQRQLAAGTFLKSVMVQLLDNWDHICLRIASCHSEQWLLCEGFFSSSL